MNILRLATVALGGSILIGCGSITVPASGITSTGEQFYGQATASLSEGKFQVTNADGVLCSGTYDPLDRSRELDMQFTCTDNRHGTIHIVRNPDLMGGVGTGTFSDGTTGEFKFGKDSGA